MKIATITCHDVYNYGASLQAYALQEYCRSLGHDYKIIDYKPPYLSNHYKLNIIANPRFDKPIVRLLYLLAKLPGRLRERKRKRLFDQFKVQYLSLTGNRYGSSGEISSAIKDGKLDADLYIAGSDQIWNTFFRNGRDEAFYLDFVGDRGRTISYAASFATERIFSGADSFVKEKLTNFDAISVRESSAMSLLSLLGYNDATLVCDPVFLLNEKAWRSIIVNVKAIKTDYILVYDCDKSAVLRDVAEELKRITQLPIYRISDTCGRYDDMDFSNSGPLEFVSLVANARYVVANSFHALAFSMIFRKDFFIVNRSEKINTRMRDFLDYLGLSERLISQHNEIDDKKIDFKQSNSRLKTLIEESKDFLTQQFNRCPSRG